VTAAVLAAAAATGAVLLLVRGPVRLPRALVPHRPVRLPGPVPVAVLAAGAAVVALSSALSGHQLVLALLGVAVALALLRLVQRARRSAAAERRATNVLAACDAMAADLAAGQPPLAALERSAAEWPELLPAVTAGRLGADVPSVLRDLAGRPGGRELRVLAAAWQVAHECGCGLAGAVAAAAGTIRERQATSRLVGTELAAARATARLMAVLPFGVLLLGAGVGGDPLSFLTDTTPGLGCLAAGLGLGYAGLVWLQAIADRVLAR
jgi:tight adherence protein B